MEAMLCMLTSILAQGPGPLRPVLAKPLALGAHRGGAALWPEDTLEAYTQAAARWPDALLEGDVRLTSDKRMILLHDADVDRTTNGSGPVAGMTFEEVRALDAGYRFTPDGGKTFPYRGKGIKIPTLEEVLSALPQARFLIELKPQPGVAEAFIAIVRKLDAVDRIIAGSYDSTAIGAVETIEPRLCRCYDIPLGMGLLAALRGKDWDAYVPAAHMLAIEEEMVDNFNITPEEIAAVRKKGVVVLVQTVNAPDAMRRFLNMGMDSVLTDRPDVLAEILEQAQKK